MFSIASLVKTIVLSGWTGRGVLQCHVPAGQLDRLARFQRGTAAARTGQRSHSSCCSVDLRGCPRARFRMRTALTTFDCRTVPTVMTARPSARAASAYTRADLHALLCLELEWIEGAGLDAARLGGEKLCAHVELS